MYMFLQNNCLIIYLLQEPSLICASLHFRGFVNLALGNVNKLQFQECIASNYVWLENDRLKTDNDKKSLLIGVRSGQVSLYQYIQNVLICQNISQYDQQRHVHLSSMLTNNWNCNRINAEAWLECIAPIHHFPLHCD